MQTRNLKIRPFVPILLFIIFTFFYAPNFAAGASLIATDKNIYNQGEAIKVSFSNSPGIEGDWICIVPAGSPDTEAGDYKYMPSGMIQGVLLFDPPAPGKYEARAYFNYRRKGYVVSDRYAFSVVSSPEGKASTAFVPASTPAKVLTQGSGVSVTIPSMTKIKHEPVKYFVAGKRIKLTAEVTDPEGIKLVRCYFKGTEQADFVFVNMTPGSATYTAILPAASRTASSIDYLFLTVNNKNQVVRTQQFRVNKNDSQPMPPWQDVAMEGQLNVSTELAQAPAALEGFTDSIAMDVVESALRFGFVAGGIYTSTQIAAAGGATGTAATATSAGTVTATTGAGLSTAAIVGIAAGVAVAGGVGVAAASSGNSKSDPPPPPATFTYNENVTRCGSYYCCTINIYVSGAPRSASVTANSTWGRSASTTANASGSAAMTLTTPSHICLSGSFTVYVNGSQIGNPVYNSCW